MTTPDTRDRDRLAALYPPGTRCRILRGALTLTESGTVTSAPYRAIWCGLDRWCVAVQPDGEQVRTMPGTALGEVLA